MTSIKQTVFFSWHTQKGAVMAPFAGYQMPIQYPTGIISEHLITRSKAGLFDISHMGRFKVRGKEALPFLQKVLSNNAAALDVGESQYTMLPDHNGGAIDDAYLYRFTADEYLLVVNAANRARDWTHLSSYQKKFNDLELIDTSEKLAMISLQGPLAKDYLQPLITSGSLPAPMRNQLSIAQTDMGRIYLGRTGYTGEPICFEIFLDIKNALDLWNRLIDQGAAPIGLGARDTLRLEAGLPLYGHELGPDINGQQIPVFACSLARFAVSFSPLKNDFIGKNALWRQFTAFKQIVNQKYHLISDLPQRIFPILLKDKGIARAGAPVLRQDKIIGYVTSGTMVPYWEFSENDITGMPTSKSGKRAIGLALLDSRCQQGDDIIIEVRGKKIAAEIVAYHMRSEVAPYVRPIVKFDQKNKLLSAEKSHLEMVQKATELIQKTIENTRWRQEECINLIPSEQTPSKAVRLLCSMDPMGRYAEHKSVKALPDVEVFSYQGTDFISKVESLLIDELNTYLECDQIEPRPISGQIANIAAFSAMVDYVNRTDRKQEQRRLKSVMNHHIIRGGHLSAQPMGALRDFVARSRTTERPAVVNFPVLDQNPYQIDLDACRKIIAENQPELIILGKSMTLHKEPVSAIRQMIDELSPDTILMYDMAHVLGLVGPFFQKPFEEGAHIVTGSTHKTFFGTQRGIIAANFKPTDRHFELWEAIERRAFPGAVSNHHLGSLLGLLMAAYEMNAFKTDYQPKVIANAKAFAQALNDLGLNVAGEPEISFTQTHQVILKVGYAKGPLFAQRLQSNNIIVNYQATPDEESFSAAGALRLGVSEMTRFGMEPDDFQKLAGLICEIIIKNKNMKAEVTAFRKNFNNIRYCFNNQDYEPLIEQLHALIG
jgi:aminomethyltransferase